MAVTNLGVSRTGVLLSRYFDGDIDGTPNEFGGISSASVFEWQPFPGHGLSLTTTSFAVQHRVAVEQFGTWAGGTQRGCTPAALPTPAGPDDLTGRATYLLGTMGAGTTKTVKFTYGRL